MPAITIDKIYFSPAVAVARLGSSPVPLEAFTWTEDPSSFGAGRTVITPQVSFHVLPDGSIDPYLPRTLQFKDAGMIRPVCPFFELHASWKEPGSGMEATGPLTPTLLEKAGLKLHDLSFKVVAANRKAFRRTGDEACIFEARGLYLATDHARKDLLAYTHNMKGEPLVFPHKPVPLGSFQIIRPGSPDERLVPLDTVRVRFTPAKGEVYGPPFAIQGQTNDSRSPHEIVPPQNRILNPESRWTKFKIELPSPSMPPDTYDGESDLDRQTCWGVVDDTCDVMITAQLSTGILPATARVLVGPPHYAPDRRTFYSLADELADRDPGSVPFLEERQKVDDKNSAPSQTEKPEKGNGAGNHKKDEEKYQEALAATVVDLFRRTLETASLMNVERQRNRAIFTNLNFILSKKLQKSQKSNPELPAFDEKTMTLEDQVQGKPFVSPLAEQALKLTSGGDSTVRPVVIKSELACEQHQKLAEPEYLLDFLLDQKSRLINILRPPFAYLAELPKHPEEHGLGQLRDPRVVRDRVHDMRMPPYMRDSDFSALSLTRRQWNQITELLEILKRGHVRGDLPYLSGVAKRIKAYHERKKKEL